MRYVRDDPRKDYEILDEENWQAAAPVGRIAYSGVSEGEIRHTQSMDKTVESESSLNGYAVNFGGKTIGT